MTASVLREATGAGGAANDEQGAYGRIGSPDELAQARPVSARRIPPKLYRMGEVVEYSGLSRQTIHNYATMGLLPESRWTAGGHRLFDEGVFGRLDEIARLKCRSKTMREIRELFSRTDE